MDNKDQLYQLPSSTNNDIRKMLFGLAWFFGILSILVILFLIYAPSILRLVPFSVEKNFVQPYEELAEYFWDEVDGETYPEIDTYLQGLADELSVAMAMPEEIDIQVHYVKSEHINAFAVIGGHIFITSGLFENVEDENSLAMVLAHELAHQQHRDPITGMSRGIAIQVMFSLLSGDVRQVDFSGFSAELGLLYFSRDQEQKADKAAIHALNTRYGHVAGYDQFFRTILNDSASAEVDLPDWLSSHPDTSGRIDYLDDLIERNGWQQRQPNALPIELLKEESTTEAIDSPLQPKQ